MIQSVLIANRGEIARRVLRSCRDRGLSTVAVFSDADADAPYVAEADCAVRLPGSSPAQTYLRSDLLIAAAKTAGADAVHPGYGFLSENADFAEAVLDAGLTWIGPPVSTIRSMGSKVAAKQLMAAAGVPVLAAMDWAGISAADLPVLIKASGGGGGRGMRIVGSLDQLEPELRRARAEAQAAFGDPTVFCEPYLAAGRHLEVQVLADAHGTVWTVSERECSIQRRHQKVIEEAPSPLVQATPGLRERLFEAARAATLAISYRGAGTVEFLADASGRFYFLEMNTRLQVEHPVTEMITGLDLVDWQLAIADGAMLPAEPPPTTGHSIEVRLYAEDPANDWQPQSGVLSRFVVPGVRSHFEVAGVDVARRVLAGRSGAPTLRLDSGIEDGSHVSVHYDPMLAKLISWAPERDTAARVLATALARAEIHGPITNRDLLVRTLRHPEFLAGAIDTGFLDRIGLSELAGPLLDERGRVLSMLAAALADAADTRLRAAVLADLPAGWRNLRSQPRRKVYRTLAGADVSIEYSLDHDEFSCPAVPSVRLISAEANSVVLDDDGVRRAFFVARYGFPGESTALVAVDSALGALQLRPVPSFAEPDEKLAPGSLIAPMPGIVTSVDVERGQVVSAGDPMIVIEAMKMQHTVAAPTAGVVGELHVAAGSQVELGTVLAVLNTEKRNLPDLEGTSP